MTKSTSIQAAYAAAMDVLRNNLYGPFHKLPRAAAWGYPEPYTRDMMISALGMMATGDPKFMKSIRRVLETTARNLSPNGHVPSYVHDPENRGASDTTPLFLMTLAMYRDLAGEPEFLDDAARRSMTWMEYQSPIDRVAVCHMPTTDWRDEHWVMGYGLFVNAVLYTSLRLFGRHDRSETLKEVLDHLTLEYRHGRKKPLEGVRISGKPYLALWSFKIYSNERFDLLGNCLAILSGLVTRSRAGRIIDWVEAHCRELQAAGQLAVDLPPCLIPYMQPGDHDWLGRYAEFNPPGHYHNGGIWPFICGFYVAALVAAGRYKLAENKLAVLAELVRGANVHREVEFGFGEYYQAQTGEAKGQDWQTWSAAGFLYAKHCVDAGEALFFPKP